MLWSKLIEVSEAWTCRDNGSWKIDIMGWNATLQKNKRNVGEKEARTARNKNARDMEEPDQANKNEVRQESLETLGYPGNRKKERWQRWSGRTKNNWFLREIQLAVRERRMPKRIRPPWTGAWQDSKKIRTIRNVCNRIYSGIEKEKLTELRVWRHPGDPGHRGCSDQSAGPAAESTEMLHKFGYDVQNWNFNHAVGILRCWSRTTVQKRLPMMVSGGNECK